jgi:hypothetical protein
MIPTQAETARHFLLATGFQPTNISVEPITVFIYDGRSYDGGKGNKDNRRGKVIVIGRK